MERLSKAQRKRERETARMTKTESQQDGEKARMIRDKGRALIGKTVNFQVFHFDPTRGSMVSTGKSTTGTVLRWCDITQSLQVGVEGELMPYTVRLEHLIEDFED